MCDSGGILKVEIRCYSLSTFLVKDIVAILLRTTLWTSLEEKKKHDCKINYFKCVKNQMNFSGLVV